LDEDILKISIIGILLIVAICLFGFFNLNAQTIDIQGHISCNTGDIDLDYILDFDHKNFSKIGFKGIDGMNCKINYGVKLPLGAIHLVSD